MENTLENKAKFFAQYLKQKVVFKTDWECFNDKSLMELDPTYLQTGNNVLVGGYLVLKPLSSITDDDQRYVLSDKLCNSMELVEEDKIGAFFISDCYLTDYLRSKGYALPYMGLSVETLVSYGWVKLTDLKYI